MKKKSRSIRETFGSKSRSREKLLLFVEPVPIKSFSRFLGSFEPTFRLFSRGPYRQAVYCPRENNRKSAKIIPEIDEKFYWDRFLIQWAILSETLFEKINPACPRFRMRKRCP